MTLEFLDRAYPDADRLVGALLRQRAIDAGDHHMRLLFGQENFVRMRNRLNAAGGNNRSVAEQLSAKAWGRMVRERADRSVSNSVPYLVADLATEYHRANPIVDEGRRRPLGSASGLSHRAEDGYTPDIEPERIVVERGPEPAAAAGSRARR